MGGAKCSYRTCTVKTDKKTHLFHFPVFDKVRCHQWITNAQKLNFLNLKLSQLKNRVICEHHFTNDCFMNDMKARLKNTAVPTEDGPFCNPVKNLEAENKEMPINLDDIENDYLTNSEKKAHFSVKYGDFLINDVTEPITKTPCCKSTSIMLQDNCMIFNRHNDKMKSYIYNPTKNLPSSEKEINMFDTKPKEIVGNGEKESASSPFSTPNPKVVAIQFEESNLNTNKKDKNHNENPAVVPPQGIAKTRVFPCHQIRSTTPISHSKKVKIISESKISQPVKVCKTELQPVSPSIVINIPNRKKKTNVEMNSREINTLYVDMANPQPVEYVQGFDNSGIISSQSAVTDQMCLLADYNQPTLIANTIEGHNNLEVQNTDLFMGSKEINYNITSEDTNSTHLKQETELLTDREPIQMVPNVEFISTSSTEPSVFTLTDVPQATTTPHLAGSVFVPHLAPTEALNTYPVSTDSEALAGTPVNPENVSSMLKNKQNVVRMSMIQNDHLQKKPEPIQSSPKTRSFLKSKMPPEKLAAIEEKRKFNIKLRDIINSCLSKLDEESDASKLTAAMKKELNEKKVGEHLSSDSGFPTTQENVIAYLEARLQRMEDTMLSKIEQNTHRITELKKTIVNPLSRKKSASTQTYINSKSVKRNLYQQISQFLTPEANSLIYEELFLNDCVASNTEATPKRRKRK